MDRDKPQIEIGLLSAKDYRENREGHTKQPTGPKLVGNGQPTSTGVDHRRRRVGS